MHVIVTLASHPSVDWFLQKQTDVSMLETEKKKKGVKKSKRRKQEESQQNDADIEAQILAKKGRSTASVRCQIQANSNRSFVLMYMLPPLFYSKNKSTRTTAFNSQI